MIEVWKSPASGCCNDWITRLKANGFRVNSYNTGNAPIRAEMGIPPKLASCHTAYIEDYVIEGRVPAREIHRLVKEQTTALGLSVPGMRFWAHPAWTVEPLTTRRSHTKCYLSSGMERLVFFKLTDLFSPHFLKEITL